MAYLEVRNVIKSYGAMRAVDDVSFTVQKGEILALLGPSGCGKTTLLGTIAGFLPIESGSVHVDGLDLSRMPPHRRNMGMVFQSYALFPHMTIERNIGFGLAMRDVPKQDVSKRVADALAAVQLKDVGQRYPRELSGGQQQRVALARALVVRPAVLLLDEPLSNLDALLRKTMRDDMRQILKAEGITAILVTHDQEEALVTADRVILMSAGHIEQVARPMDLYERPRTAFCARFMEVSNLYDGEVLAAEEDHALVNTRLGILRTQPTDSSIGDCVTIAIRAENITVASGDGDNHVVGRVVRDSYQGAVRRVDITVNDQVVVAHIPAKYCKAKMGGELALSWSAHETLVLGNRDALAVEATQALAATA